MVHSFPERFWVMEDVNPSSGSTMGAVAGNYVDLDLIGDLLFADDWLEIPDCTSFLIPSASASPNPLDTSDIPPRPDTIKDSVAPRLLEVITEEDIARTDLLPSHPVGLQGEDGNHAGPSLNQECSTSVNNDNPESSRSWAVQSTADLALVPTIKERITYALRNIKESHRDRDVLVQMWVPVQNGSQRVLTTCGQPFWLDVSCERLVGYRAVSTNYHFAAEENSEEATLGLPGRVFIGKVPEWTPDVRLFTSKEYPRVNYAHRYDVRGSLALPVFERGGNSCLGVVEIVLTTEKINYSSDLENICKALQAVDLRTSDISSITHVKVRNYSYQAALPEIYEVLEVVCKMHKLPLAQTWIPCIFQGRIGSSHSDKNYKACVSTLDSACFVHDPSMLGFHEACSEHHLFKGQGVAGKAFTTNLPCFSPDITTMSKSDYPLSHHARMFNLKSAVAIRLRSVQTGAADFVLEFFLPVNCIDFEEQKRLLNSLSITIQQVCRTLRVVTEKELMGEMNLFGNSFLGDKVYSNLISCETRSPKEEGTSMVEVSDTVETSWLSSMLETQADSKNESYPHAQFHLKDQGLQGFNVTTGWGDHKVMIWGGGKVSELEEKQSMDSKDIDFRNSVSGECSLPNSKRTIGKKRTKAEKTISLQVLQQYFAGSLKDAAKGLGVCPTTLKRICRQHGISRWPSRKIKKVGHSLQKLQKVIDSVEGVDGTFKLTSLYTHLSEPSVSDMPAPNILGNSDAPLRPCHQVESLAPNLFNVNPSTSNSQSSCSRNSSSSPCSSETKNGSENVSQAEAKGDTISFKNQSDNIKRTQSEAELHRRILEPTKTLAKSHSHKCLIQLPSDHTSLVGKSHTENLLRVKVVYGEDKVRFKYQPSSGFQCLREEIAKRFNIGNPNSIDIRYMDDDSEWVLLTCDADLQECVDVYRSTFTDTVKISIGLAAPPFSIGSSGFS